MSILTELPSFRVGPENTFGGSRKIVGPWEGKVVGEREGPAVFSVGAWEGKAVGERDGIVVSGVGVGPREGEAVGERDGAAVGICRKT